MSCRKLSVRTLEMVLPGQISDPLRVLTEQRQCSARDGGGLGVESLLKLGRNRSGAVRQRDPNDGSLQPSPGLLSRQGRDLAGDAAKLPAGVRYDQAPGLLHGSENGRFIEWSNAVEIDHVGIDIV